MALYFAHSDDRSKAGVAAAGGKQQAACSAAAAAAAGIAAAKEGGGPPVGTEAIGPSGWWRTILWVFHLMSWKRQLTDPRNPAGKKHNINKYE